MSRIFVRERREVGKGAGRPRFAVVAVESTDLKVFAPHLRKAELEALATAVGAELVFLPRGEKTSEEEEKERGGSGRHGGWNRHHG
jgi:hypothetical protein